MFKMGSTDTLEGLNRVLGHSNSNNKIVMGDFYAFCFFETSCISFKFTNFYIDIMQVKIQELKSFNDF